MVRAIIASKNDGKIEEIRSILAIPGLELVTYRDLPGWPEIREEAGSFYANALIKAETLVDEFGMSAIADDSGLEVEALGGAPGIFSARYAGNEANDKTNNEKLLSELNGLDFENRRASFRCSAVYMDEHKRIISAEGTLEGHIGFEPRGGGGFGYDPIFIPEAFEKTLAELGADLKNEISHRAKAFRLLKIELEKVIGAEHD